MCYTMKQTNFWRALCLLLVLAFSAQAAKERSNSRVNEPNTTNRKVVVVYDNKFGQTPSGWFDKTYTGKISFGLNEELKAYYAQSRVQFELTFDVKAYYTNGGPQVHTGQKLVIVYDRGEGKPYTDLATWVKTGMNKLEVTVTGVVAKDVTGATPVTLASVPQGIFLEAEIETSVTMHLTLSFHQTLALQN
jgi:hypothetical protein